MLRHWDTLNRRFLFLSLTGFIDPAKHRDTRGRKKEVAKLNAAEKLQLAEELSSATAAVEDQRKAVKHTTTLLGLVQKKGLLLDKCVQRFTTPEKRGRKPAERTQLQPGDEQDPEKAKTRDALLRKVRRKRLGDGKTRQRIDLSPLKRQELTQLIDFTANGKDEILQGKRFWDHLEKESQVNAKILKNLVSPKGRELTQQKLQLAKPRGRNRYWKKFLERRIDSFCIFDSSTRLPVFDFLLLTTESAFRLFGYQLMADLW